MTTTTTPAGGDPPSSGSNDPAGGPSSHSRAGPSPTAQSEEAAATAVSGTVKTHGSGGRPLVVDMEDSEVAVTSPVDIATSERIAVEPATSTLAVSSKEATARARPPGTGTASPMRKASASPPPPRPPLQSEPGTASHRPDNHVTRAIIPMTTTIGSGSGSASPAVAPSSSRLHSHHHGDVPIVDHSAHPIAHDTPVQLPPMREYVRRSLSMDAGNDPVHGHKSMSQPHLPSLRTMLEFNAVAAEEVSRNGHRHHQQQQQWDPRAVEMDGGEPPVLLLGMQELLQRRALQQQARYTQQQQAQYTHQQQQTLLHQQKQELYQQQTLQQHQQQLHQDLARPYSMVPPQFYTLTPSASMQQPSSSNYGQEQRISTQQQLREAAAQAASRFVQTGSSSNNTGTSTRSSFQSRSPQALRINVPYPADAAIPPGPPSDPGPGDSAAMRAYQQQLQSLAHRQHAMMMPPLLSPAPTASGVSSTRASISGTMEELSVAARAAAAEDAREAGQVRRAAKRPRYAVPVDRQADRLADRETLTSEDVIAIFRKMRESNRTIKCQRDVAMLALLLDPKISLRKVSGLLYKDVAKIIAGTSEMLQDHTVETTDTPARDIPCHPRTCEMLREWITATETQFGWSYTHNDPVFVSLINGPPYGRAPLTRDAVAKTIFRVKASAGDFGNKDHSKWTGFADVAAYL